MLNELAQEIHENAKSHGWYEKPPTLPETIALCHAELSEALEAYRDGTDRISELLIYFTGTSQSGKVFISDTQTEICKKPVGTATELADCIIRILDYCAYAGIDIDEIIRLKHEYNKTRPYRHGNKRI